MKAAGNCTKYIEQIKSMLTAEKQTEFLVLLKKIRDKTITTPYDIAGTMYRIFKESKTEHTALVCHEFHKLLPTDISQEYINQFAKLYENICAPSTESQKRKYHSLNEQWIENPKKLYQTKIYETPPYKASNVAHPIAKSEKVINAPSVVANMNTPSTTSKTEENSENKNDKIKVDLCATNDDSAKKMKESLKIDANLLADSNKQNNSKNEEKAFQVDDNKEIKNESEQDRKENDDVKCIICYDSERKNNIFKKSKCGHIACDKCWQKWLNCCLECPMCKARTRYKQLVEC